MKIPNMQKFQDMLCGVTLRDKFGNLMKVVDLDSGEMPVEVEVIKGAVYWRPSLRPFTEGSTVWLGFNRSVVHDLYQAYQDDHVTIVRELAPVDDRLKPLWEEYLATNAEFIKFFNIVRTL